MLVPIYLRPNATRQIHRAVRKQVRKQFDNFRQTTLIDPVVCTVQNRMVIDGLRKERAGARRRLCSVEISLGVSYYSVVDYSWRNYRGNDT